MTFIPDDDSKFKNGVNLTSMIDFLFLMLAFFACLAVSRVTIRDTDIDLVEIRPEPQAIVTKDSNDTKIIRINVSSNNEYKWVTEIRDYKIDNADEIAQELLKQHEKGLLPEDKEKTTVLLKIDKEAQWEPILKLLFAIREAGFGVRPVYQPEENKEHTVATP